METVRDNGPRIEIDLEASKVHLWLHPGQEWTLHFDTASRRFYLALIAFVAIAARNGNGSRWVSLSRHIDLLVLLNETVGVRAGSSHPRSLLRRIYRKWKGALPDLANAPLFRVLGRHRPSGRDAAAGHPFSEAECDLWANLFEYRGSDENVQLRLAVERLGAGADGISVRYREVHDEPAWNAFLATLPVIRPAGDEAGPGGAAEAPMVGAVPTSAAPLSLPATAPDVTASARPTSRHRVMLLGALCALAAAVLYALQGVRAPETSPVNARTYAVPAAPVIAVLPFIGMGGEAAEELLAAGFALEIVGALSRVPDLSVVSPLGVTGADPTDPSEAALATGANYVLQGTLGRSGDRLRVSMQLIEASSGRPVRAERFERTIGDLFAVQDEITMGVLSALQGSLTVGAPGRLWSRRTRSVEAYLKYLEAISLLARQTRASNVEAQRVAAEVIRLDPDYPRGHVALAQTHLWDILLGISAVPADSLAAARSAAEAALALDAEDPTALGVLGSAYLMDRQHERAVAQIERAVVLDPDAWDTRVRQGFILLNAGREAEAIEAILHVRRRHPNHYVQPYYYLHLATAYRLDGRLEESIRTGEEAVARLPDNLLIRLQLAAAHQDAGNEEAARMQAREILRIDPKFNRARYGATLYYRDPAQISRLIDALRAAGLP